MKLDFKFIALLIAGFSGLMLAIGVAYALFALTSLSVIFSAIIGAIVGCVEYYVLKFILLKTLNGRTPR